MNESITINGEVYYKSNPPTGASGNIKICVLQRGHVLIGRLERDGSECKLHNASVIRSWGTSRGLGELAENGPLTNTKLDKCNGLVEFDYLTVVFTLSVEESKWLNVL
jgi:hypothetical protein